LIFLVAAALLSLERITYILVSRYPELFRTTCERGLDGALGQPVTALRRLFYVFKALQLLTFVAWCYEFGYGSSVLVHKRIGAVIIGATLVILGQALNWGVFYRLGASGVFYGNRFGHEIPWCREFPFSLFNHPQYVGAVASIWGFFIAILFPYPDWYLLPALETVYYGIGAWLEV
jgi:phosphatidyl-N-methylethanolamine N-methyltransferase